MSREQELSLIQELQDLGAWCSSPGDYGKSGCHASFFLDAEHLLAAARHLLDKGYFLEDLSGVDVAEGIMLCYHFDRFDRCERLVLRVLAPHANKKAPSIVSVYTGADWHERECFDFYGVVFEGHPNLKPLLLPEDLGQNPLVKVSGRKSMYDLLPLDILVDSKS